MNAKVAILLVAALAVVAVNGQGNTCVPLGGRLLQTCQDELSLLQKYYPLDSSSPPTDAQLSDINANKPDNLPTEACCTAVKAFDDGACACDASIPPLLGTLGLSASSTGLQGVAGISGKLCDFTPHTC